MDWISNIALGIGTAVTPANILYCFLGCLMGTLVGVLPGLGPITTIAILLPVTVYLPPESALIMMAGIYYGAQYGGSTTAILVRLPGEPSAIVTAIDGYEMAKRGRAGTALAIAALASLLAGVIATFVIAFASLPLARFAVTFGSAEFFMLMVLGLMVAVSMAQTGFLKALGMMVIGILVGLIGIDINSGMPRLDFGLIDLMEGMSLIAIAMGIYGITEIIINLETGTGAEHRRMPIGRLMPTLRDLKVSLPAALRGTAVGSFLGLFPGGGASMASFVSYGLEKRVSKNREEFGHGAIQGVAGPEAANNASAQTSFIPLLTLGIPASATMALMVAVLLIQGIQPSPKIMFNQPELFWGLIVSMLIGNVMLVALNLPLVGVWVRLARTPYKYLFLCIIVFCCIGVYSDTNSTFEIYMLAFWGAAGYLLHKLSCDPAPMLLGMILGPQVEDHFIRAMSISRGDPAIFVERPISLVLLLVIVGLVLFQVVSLLRKRWAGAGEPALP